MAPTIPRYAAPEPIAAHHALALFRCGKPEMDAWLREHALRNEDSSFSRTYVVTEGGETVVAYYSIALGSIARSDLPRGLRHGAPSEVPVMLLARLAVALDHGNQGLGSHLLREAMLRMLQIAAMGSGRALIVHALDEEAAAFYRRFGFVDSPSVPLTMILPIETIREAFLRSRGDRI